jgi:putative transposase
VFDYYTRWRSDGTLDRLLDALRRRSREQAGRTEEPTAAVADSQSAPTTQAGGEQRGYDGGKKVKGRKRHILVDTLGLLPGVMVTAANVSDGHPERTVSVLEVRCQFACTRPMSGVFTGAATP